MSATKLLLILCLALLVRVVLAGYYWPQPDFHLQQDNYADFAQALSSGSLNTDLPQLDTRLFPGYPALISALAPIFGDFLKAGIFINLVATLLSIIIFANLTKSLNATALFAVFPPIWIKQSLKVATEPVTAFFCLLAIYLFLRHRHFLSGMILGYAFSIRLIVICLFAALLFSHLRRLSLRSLLNFILPFLFLAPATIIFNYFAYGPSGLLRQFIVNSQYGRATFGIPMIISDIFRTLDWGQYRIFASGVFYLAFFLVGHYFLFRLRRVNPLLSIFHLWSAFSLLFIFSISPTPLIQDFGRYAVIFAPAALFGLWLGLGGILNSYAGFRRHSR